MDKLNPDCAELFTNLNKNITMLNLKVDTLKINDIKHMDDKLKLILGIVMVLVPCIFALVAVVIAVAVAVLL